MEPLNLKSSVKQGTIITYLATLETCYNSMVYWIYGEKLTSSLKISFQMSFVTQYLLHISTKQQYITHNKFKQENKQTN